MDDQDLEREIKAQKNPDLQKWGSDVCQKNTVLEAQNKTAHDKIQALEAELDALLEGARSMKAQDVASE
ncbi:MAG: hypothetical protein JWR01_2922 [Subtercola sp.]|nr:hypothetical protein [Subtercola sp.]